MNGSRNWLLERFRMRFDYTAHQRLLPYSLPVASGRRTNVFKSKKSETRRQGNSGGGNRLL